MFGIIGSGFGLYGYLPAIVKSTAKNILIMEKAFEIFKNRFELQFCKDRIIWIKNETEFYESIENLILCVPPEVQVNIIEKWGKLPNIKRIILEKPLAENPTKAKTLLNLLKINNNKIIIGYTFQYTEWAKELSKIINNNIGSIESITIEWNFKAHHYRNQTHTWKRYHTKGGGALRFFGIHIIALLSLLGYDGINKSITLGFSDDDIFQWSAQFIKRGSPKFNVVVNSNSENEEFKIFFNFESYLDSIPQVDIASPFSTKIVETTDARVPILNKLINEMESIQDPSIYFQRYEKVNLLWEEVEASNVYTTI